MALEILLVIGGESGKTRTTIPNRAMGLRKEEKRKEKNKKKRLYL
jgi:hypothetical protein